MSYETPRYEDGTINRHAEQVALDQLKNRKRLVKALRSGKYKQVKGALRSFIEKGDKESGIGYCCLGVACDITPDRTKRLGLRWSGYDEDEGGFRLSLGDGTYEANILPSSVREEYGISSSGIFAPPISYIDKYGKYQTANVLTALNDEAGYTFEQIADVIEDCDNPDTERHWITA